MSISISTAGFIRKWMVGVLAIFILLVLPIAALLLRGKEALWGISWGVTDTVCEWGWGDCSLPKNTVSWGVYDYEGTLTDVQLGIEHIYVQWNAYSVGNLVSQLNRAASRNRWPLVTIEPFAKPSLQKEKLLQDVIRGSYDEDLKAICSDLGVFGKPVFVRWGHEMERVTGRYPWAVEQGDVYVKAYRHAVNTCKKFIGHEVYFVWSPAGDKGLENYWPGKEYADYVGISVYGFPQWEEDVYGKERSFQENFGEKYERVKQYERPVMIAELGIIGDEYYRKEWLSDLRYSLAEFPQLQSIVYFNAVDSPEAWGPQYPVPDWRINKELFEQFVY